MKAKDPVREKLRAERSAASLKVNILRRGIGHELSEGYNDVEDLEALLDAIQSMLEPAVVELKAAEDAYKPYWSRRRVRITRVSSKKKKVA